MQISKTVTVTIETDLDDVTKCNLTCSQAEECRFCRRYGDDGIDGIGGYEFSHNDDKRHPLCLAEFGTGEKPNVVPWEESKVGDVVDFNGRMALIGLPPFVEDVCAECYMFVDGICRAVRRGVPLCTEHHSGHRVFFNKPGESK
jgi:hypothetical protein